MFFRPEEGHGASGITYVFAPIYQGNSYVTDNTLWICLKNFTITHLYLDWFTTVQTWRVNPNAFAGK